MIYPTSQQLTGEEQEELTLLGSFYACKTAGCIGLETYIHQKALSFFSHYSIFSWETLFPKNLSKDVCTQFTNLDVPIPFQGDFTFRDSQQKSTNPGDVLCYLPRECFDRRFKDCEMSSNFNPEKLCSKRCNLHNYAGNISVVDKGTATTHINSNERPLTSRWNSYQQKSYKTSAKHRDIFRLLKKDWQRRDSNH